jgi:hypothetical protein
LTPPQSDTPHVPAELVRKVYFTLKSSTEGCVRYIARSLRAKVARDGWVLKKNRCEPHKQSDAPNPATGIDAPRCKLRQFAHRHSHGVRS